MGEVIILANIANETIYRTTTVSYHQVAVLFVEPAYGIKLHIKVLHKRPNTYYICVCYRAILHVCLCVFIYLFIASTRENEDT